jgi:tRNA(Ile)-lysidine synthase
MGQPFRPGAVAVGRFRDDLARWCAVDSVRLLVAVSGGPDSLALLLLAHELLGDRCMAATVDHRVRRESTAEAVFVRTLCRERGIAHHILSGPEADASGPANLPSSLRLLRYALLKVEMADAGADLLATAHHLEDQRETVLMRLARGSGVAGLAGIRARQGSIIRPVLGWRRAELAAVVADCGVEPVDDPSNRDDRYDRARLRKLLADADWLDAARVARSARALADAEDALVWAAEIAGRDAVRRVSADAIEIAPGSLPFELLRRVIERCLSRLRPAAAPRGGDVAALVDALRRGETATLAEVVASVVQTGDGPIWHLCPAPPRRTGKPSQTGR